MKILITGSNGFVGQALCAYLESSGRDVVRTVRIARFPGEFAVGDIGRETNWKPVLEGCVAVIHLAARVHVMHDDVLDSLAEYRKVNTDGTINLARQAAAAGVRRFVYLSSIKVNGESTNVINISSSGQISTFSENDLVAPQDDYAVSKWEAEQALQMIARETGMEVVIVRPPLVYGPGVKGNFAALLTWVSKGIPLPLGAAHNKRSLVALDNLVSFIALCVDQNESRKAANQTFLISDIEDVSTIELLRKVARAYGVKVRLIPVPLRWMQFIASLLGKKAVADRLLGSLLINSSKAHELLGWQPVITMDEQLRKMALHDSLV